MNKFSISPGPWKPVKWWEHAGLRLNDALDDEERKDWERAPVVAIIDGNEQIVVSCHDLSIIKSSDAVLMSEAGTVSNETGLSPRELLNHLKEICESLPLDMVEREDSLDAAEFVDNSNAFMTAMRKAKAVLDGI